MKWPKPIQSSELRMSYFSIRQSRHALRILFYCHTSSLNNVCRKLFTNYSQPCRMWLKKSCKTVFAVRETKTSDDTPTIFRYIQQLSEGIVNTHFGDL